MADRASRAAKRASTSANGRVACFAWASATGAWARGGNRRQFLPEVGYRSTRGGCQSRPRD
eukprot:7030519-Alexandrium_andersonii.AAC.1